MKNHQVLPKMLPLILILIGTTLLAFPAAIGTAALFETSTQYPHVGNSFGQLFFCVSIVGFALFAGYILTAIFRRHFGTFWLCSLLYNFSLSCCYLYFFGVEAKYNPIEVVRLVWISLPHSLILPWTIFVTVASGYYCMSTLRPKSLDFS